eukprot:PITA_29985
MMPHKLRLFPANIKGISTKMVHGTCEHAITDWDGMRRIFLRKYQPYCRSKDCKYDIFRMNQQEDESLEEYLERFAYNLQKSKHRSMILDLIRAIFLKGIREEYLDDLNLMGKGDISTLPFEEIADLCEKYSRSKAKIGKRTISSKVTKSASASVTRAEIGNLLEEFKTDLLSTLGTQIDTLKAKKIQEGIVMWQPTQIWRMCILWAQRDHGSQDLHLKQQVVYPHQPQPTQQALPAPPPINPPQLQLPSNPQPHRPTQIPAQPVPNPNNRAERLTYNVDEGPSYPTLPLKNINLRYGKVLHKESPAADKQEENEENENETPIQRKPNDDIKNKQMQPLHPPPFLDRLVQTKLPMSIPQFDVLDELKNFYIKIPLLQAIKDIPIYTKAIKELCLKKPTRKRVDPQNIHVIRDLAGLMTNTILMEKYVDPGIPRVTTIINNIHIPNTLIDLGPQ